MLAKLYDAKIYAVYVAPALTQYVGFHMNANTIDGFIGEVVSNAESSMEDFVATYFDGVEVTTEVIVGYPKEEIINFAKNNEVDLVVMGTHGRKGVDRVLFGSIAEKVLVQSPVPVVTIRPKGQTATHYK